MVRTLLVPDDALGWQDLAAQLAGCSGITAVQPAADPATATQLAVTWRPDLVVLVAGLLREPLDPALGELVQRAPSVLLARALPVQLVATLLNSGLPLRGVLT